MASSQKRLPLVIVVLPLVAVLAVAGVVGFNMFRDYQRSEAEDEEAKRTLALAQQQKMKKPQVVEEAPAPVDEPEDELGALPGQRKKPKPAAPVNQTPAQKAYFGFKSAYDKLENANENAARKFRARKLQLDDQYSGGKPANEAKFVSDCDTTRAQILELLRNPENQ